MGGKSGFCTQIIDFTGYPRSGKKWGKKIFFQGQGIVREFWNIAESQGKVREFLNKKSGKSQNSIYDKNIKIELGSPSKVQF